jgi:undecaprenyl-diphosphatase
MTYGEALLYGAVQGITEYLPISSSAHLILLPKFLGTQDPGLTFDVFLHIGTLLATLSYFWRDWLGVFANFRWRGKQVAQDARWPETVSLQLIVVATLPALIAGALFHDSIETVLRGNRFLATGLVVGGLLLFLSDRYSKTTRTLKESTFRDALWVGIAQCFALSPGISRSGSTMTGARLLGFDRAASARFSFLLSAPVTGAAIVFQLRHWRELFDGAIGMGPLLVAGFSSFFFGCVAIGGLLAMLRRFGFLTFALYRVCLAVAIIQLLGV